MGNWKSNDPLLIETEIKLGSATLIHVFTLTCMKVRLIGIHMMRKECKWPSLIDYKIKIRELYRLYLAFYPSLDIYLNNIVTLSLSHSHFPLSLWKDDNLRIFFNEERKACPPTTDCFLCIIRTYLVLFVHEVDCSRQANLVN